MCFKKTHEATEVVACLHCAASGRLFIVLQHPAPSAESPNLKLTFAEYSSENGQFDFEQAPKSTPLELNLDAPAITSAERRLKIEYIFSQTSLLLIYSDRLLSVSLDLSNLQTPIATKSDTMKFAHDQLLGHVAGSGKVLLWYLQNSKFKIGMFEFSRNQLTHLHESKARIQRVFLNETHQHLVYFLQANQVFELDVSSGTCESVFDSVKKVYFADFWDEKQSLIINTYNSIEFIYPEKNSSHSIRYKNAIKARATGQRMLLL